MLIFAVYYVPPADSDLYRHAHCNRESPTRAGTMLPDDNPTRRTVPEFDLAWIKQPQTYGFHVTTYWLLMLALTL